MQHCLLLIAERKLHPYLIIITLQDHFYFHHIFFASFYYFFQPFICSISSENQIGPHLEENLIHQNDLF